MADAPDEFRERIEHEIRETIGHARYYGVTRRTIYEILLAIAMGHAPAAIRDPAKAAAKLLDHVRRPGAQPVKFDARGLGRVYVLYDRAARVYEVRTGKGAPVRGKRADAHLALVAVLSMAAESKKAKPPSGDE